MNAFQPAIAGGGFDGFVVKFNAKAQVAYASYLGGKSLDIPFRVAVDSIGQAAIVGFTQSLDFPLVNPLQAGYAGGIWDAFVAKVSASGTSLSYSSYFGGGGDDYGYAIYSDGGDNTWIGGSTSSSRDFPIANAYQPSYAGGPFDAFLSHIVTDSTKAPPSSTSRNDEQFGTHLRSTWTKP